MFGAASADSGRVYVGDQSEKVYALDPETGDPQRQFGGSPTAVRFLQSAPLPSTARSSSPQTTAQWPP